MREKARIKRILKLIEKVWMEYPDMRLGQLLQNYAGFTREDNWHIEDDETEFWLQTMVDTMEFQKRYKEDGTVICPKCKTPFKKLDKYTFQPDCEHYNKDLRLSVG